MRLLFAILIFLCASTVEARGRRNRGYDYDAEPSAERTIAPVGQAVDALGEVNVRRARMGLRPFQRITCLTEAAKRVCTYRAQHGISGHVGDFSYLPEGCEASAAGCGVTSADGWASCCWTESYTYAGAAYVMRGQSKYCHIFVS